MDARGGVPELVRVDAGAAGELAARLLEESGCPQEEARVVADHLVEACLTGHDSHGIIRLVRYHEWLRDDILVGGAQLTTLLDSGALLQFDANRGMGQYLGRKAAAIGIGRARETGIALVAVRRAGHLGRLGSYAEQACAAGLVSVQFANFAGSRLVAPFGAAERRISTAPIAIGVPNGEGDDFILDFATSLVAEGKALVAAQGGKALPHGALVDADGALTSDPRALYGDTIESAAPDPRGGSGALRAMGEHKGSGLALACELLGGALTGNGTNATHGAFGNGWFALFADPARLDGAMAEEVPAYVEAVRGARPAQGVEHVLIPGDVERRNRADRSRNGIPVARPVLDGILALAARLAVTPPGGLVLGEAAVRR